MNISAQQKRKTEESRITIRIPPEIIGTAPDTGERTARLYRQRRSYLALAFRNGKEKGEEKDMFFKRWKEKKEKEITDKEITDRLNELLDKYRNECVWYMIISGMPAEEIKKQDVSADHLMETALKEAIGAVQEMSEEIRRKRKCATESELSH